MSDVECPECGNGRIIDDHNEWVCPQCDTEPTLSQDVLEAVPAWGVALKADIDDLKDLGNVCYQERCNTYKMLGELEERVAKLERDLD